MPDFRLNPRHERPYFLYRVRQNYRAQDFSLEKPCPVRYNLVEKEAVTGIKSLSEFGMSHDINPM